MKFFYSAAIAALSLASVPAFAAAPTIDGNYDASYGAAKSSVTYSTLAPTSNFQNPTQFSNTTNYNIYLSSDANNVYGLLRSDTVTGNNFANLYFDLDPQNGNGSDIGFEITNDRAFVAGVGGYSGALNGLTYAIASDGMGIEFAIANSYFTSAIPGLSGYDPNQQFASNGSQIALRLSQSFGYSVNGGPSYDLTSPANCRLGCATIGGGGSVGAVPEPSSWAMMVVGFGALGFTMRRKQNQLPAAMHA